MLDLKCPCDDDRFKIAGLSSLHVLAECAVLGFMYVRDMIT